jgi:hypothetical protein
MSLSSSDASQASKTTFDHPAYDLDRGADYEMLEARCPGSRIRAISQQPASFSPGRRRNVNRLDAVPRANAAKQTGAKWR